MATPLHEEGLAREDSLLDVELTNRKRGCFHSFKPQGNHHLSKSQLQCCGEPFVRLNIGGETCAARAPRATFPRCFQVRK